MNKKPLFLLAIATAMLASCSDPQPLISSGEHSSGLVVSSHTSEAMTEVDDVDIETGEYMTTNTIYAFDKAAKKVTVTRYPTYSSYKAKTGEKLLETPVKYIIYSGSAIAHYQKVNAITFEDKTTTYYIFPLEGVIRLDSYNTESHVRTSLPLTTVGDIIEPTYGHYVSTEQTQYKVDAQGQKIETSDGGYLRETFFIHLELEEKSAAAQELQELERRETSLRLMLLERDEIWERTERGMELLEAADDYTALLSRQILDHFSDLLWIGGLLVFGGVIGFLQIPSAFEKNKSRFWLIAPVFLCLGCAVATELLCRMQGRGDSYSALGAAIFALVQLALVIPKKKMKT